MKKVNVIFLVLTLVLNSILNVQTLIASNMPPAPRDGGFDNGGTVGSPIDNYLIILFIVALTFGSLMINKHRINKVL